MAKRQSYIQMDCDLRESFGFVIIKDKLELIDRDVIGALYIVWNYADRGEEIDGDSLRSGTSAYIDGLCGIRGFAEAMVAADWLEFDDDTKKLRFTGYFERKHSKNGTIRSRKSKESGDGNAKQRSGKAEKRSEGVPGAPKSAPEDTTSKKARKQESKKAEEASAPPLQIAPYDDFDDLTLDHTVDEIDAHKLTGELIRRWNALPSAILLDSQKWPEDRPDAILRHVGESVLNPTLRPIITDLNGLFSAIEKNTLLHLNGRWKLSTLFGWTTDGDMYRLEKLLGNGYIKDDARASPQQSEPHQLTDAEINAKLGITDDDE